MRKNRSVAVMWLFSYLAVFIIPVAVSIVTYVSFEKVLVEQVKENNENVLYNKSKLIDDVVLRASSIAYLNAVSVDVNRFASLKRPFTQTQLLEMNRFREQWNKNFDIGNKDIVTAYVYLPKSDCIIPSSNMKSRRFFDTVYGGSDEEYDGWMRIITNAENREIYTLKIGDDVNRIFYVMRSVGDIFGSEAPCAVVEISPEVFSRISIEERNTGLYVIDSVGSLIYGNGGDDWKALSQSAEIEKEGKRVVSRIRSTETGIVCVYVQNRVQYLREVEYLRLFILCALGVCVAVCFVLIKKFIKMNNEPIEKILTTLNHNEIPQNMNEYQYINGAIEKVFGKNKEYEDSLYLQKRFFRSDLLARLLTNNSDIDDSILKSFDIRFENDEFIVALLCIKQTDKLFFENDPSGGNIELALYSIENVLDELMNEKFLCYVFTYRGVIHCIINPKTRGGDVRKKVIGIVEELNLFSDKNINTSLVTAISKTYKGCENLPTAYREAKNLLEYRFVNPQKNIFEAEPEDKQKKEQGYAYSLKTEQKAINCIKSGDYSEAINILNEVFEINSNNNYMALPMVKCLVFDVLCTLIKISDEVGASEDKKGIDKISIYNRIMNCTSVVHVREEVDDIITQFSSYIGKKSMQKSIEFIAERAKELVDENYTNPEVTVAYVADKMNVTANYMSALFKETYKIGLLEYISELRVKKAKELLRTTNTSIDKISETVGFSTTRTFSRTFVRLEGITPGKFRLLENGD